MTLRLGPNLVVVQQTKEALDPTTPEVLRS
jgi:hypothetical protein